MKSLLNLAILTSLSLHTSAFFLFSIVVPTKAKVFSPIEVVLVKELPGTKRIKPVPAIERAKISPSLPKGEREKDEVTIYLPVKKLLPERIVARESSFTGKREFLDFRKTLFEEIKIPLPPPPLPIRTEGRNSFSSSGIYGPGGSRKVLSKVLPVYPGWAEEEGIECTLLLKLWILPEGSVEKVEVEKSSGYPRIDLLSAESTKKWRFNPVSTSEKVWGILPLKFQLQ
ncbi:MAG: TonB family protein [Candidatus Omnitrophica bacterium]|nr:TonB family protein [Candidatus Omnitrophota bacterium]